MDCAISIRYFDPQYSTYGFEGNIEIGRQGNNTLIGVDGDGVNDAEERNVIGGAVPEAYDHNIEFYGNTPGTNIVIAGNYIGIGIDGLTRFTNGVPALNASGDAASYRFGSNLDGISDDLEANHVYNLYPADLFPSGDYFNRQESLNFYDELSASASVSLRGNVLVNNFPAPSGPWRDDGTVPHQLHGQGGRRYRAECAPRPRDRQHLDAAPRHCPAREHQLPDGFHRRLHCEQ